MNPIREIKRFAKDRLIDKLEPNMLDYATNVVEELLEGYGGSYNKDSRIGLKSRLNDFIVSELKAQNVPLNQRIDEEDIIDSIMDICVFSLTEAMKYGYNPDIALNQTALEINSRKQDPIQKEKWKLNGINGKWQKWVNQPNKTLYKANYSVCKIRK